MIKKAELGFFFLLAFISAVFSFFILKPYIGSLFVAMVFGIVFSPLYSWILAIVRRAGIASFLTLVFLFFVVLIPATLFGFFIFDDAKNLYGQAGQGIAISERLDALARPIEAIVRDFIPEARINVSQYIDAALSFLVDNFRGVFSRVINFVFQIFIMSLALFYIFRDGKKLRSLVISFSPLSNEYDEIILSRIEGAISSVVKGKLLIVLIQGILASFAFVAFGVPHPVLWGAFTAISALIPAVGVAIVFVPLIIYLFFTGAVASAIGLLVVGFFIGLVDNLLGPIFFEKGLQMHPLLILLSVLGGLMLFGPVGFLAGPVILSLFFALLNLYPLILEKKH